MPRLIDADALKALIIRRRKEAKTLTGIDMVMVIDDAPTVDAAPVVHSRWIDPVPGDGFPYCGNCKAPALNKGLFLNQKLMDWYKTKYCPNCGAKMDLEEQENAT